MTKQVETIIVFDSLTGNTERFVERMKKTKPNWQYFKIVDDLEINQKFHLITYTTGVGEISPATAKFLAKNCQNMLTVSSAGNRNWGENYAIAAEKISQQYNVPILQKFEVADYQQAINDMITKIEGRLYEK